MGYKAIEDSIEKKLYEQMNQRVNTDKGKKMARLRSSTVEPVLGTLVNFTAMSKVYTKVINLANKCYKSCQQMYDYGSGCLQP